ncbi:MAG: T9SS type A sorting domain-containing protein [Bacteroidia bacterium]|nr:T9SS type A sorting domain-containing protein [Bacteroidia bacterium]
MHKLLFHCYLSILKSSKIVFLLLLCCCSTNFFSNSIRFKQSIGGNATPDNGYCARQTFDRGYVAVGTTANSSFGNTDIYVVKTDSMGIVIWTKNFGTTSIEAARYVEQTADSSLIIVGYTNNVVGNGYDIYLLKIDRNGNKLWDKTYGGSDWDFAYSVHQTSDGGYIVAGGTYSYGKGNEDFYLIKTDLNGDTLWTKTYGGTDDDEAHSVRITSDGGYLLAGETKSFSDSNGDAYIIKTNSTGDTLWTKTYGGSKEDLANDIIESTNGNYIFCGRTYSYSNTEANFYLMRLQNNGVKIWEQTGYIKDSIYDSLEGIVELKNGNIASIGISYSWGGGQDDGFLLITDALGNYIDGPTYGTGGRDQCYSIAITNDKGFIICGSTDSTQIGFNQPNLFLVKTDSTGHIPGLKYWFSVTEKNNTAISEVTIYPNPLHSTAHLSFSSAESLTPSDIKITLTDIIGREHLINYSLASIHEKRFDLLISNENLNAGVYFVTIYLKQSHAAVSKIIIQ